MSTTNRYHVLATGCPDELSSQDGDTAPTAKGTVECSETDSRKYANPPRGGPLQPVQGPSTYEIERRLSAPETSQVHMTGAHMERAGAEGQANGSSNGEVQQGQTVRPKPLPPFIQRLQDSRDEIQSHLGRKSGFKVATLNIKGQYNTFKQSKYKALWHLIRKNRIAITGLTETKLKADDESKLNEANPGMHIISNPSTDGNQAKGGVAFALNRSIVKDKKWSHTILVPGHLSKLKIEWTETHQSTIYLTYTPNTEPSIKLEYLNSLYQIMKEENPTSCILMGDWNCVESKYDRYPRHEDNHRFTAPLRDIKTELNLIDGWRITHPTDKKFTYFHHYPNSMSRIDRIYCTKDIFYSAYNWDIVNSSGLSDHDMPVMEILKKDLPYIGEGTQRIYSSQLDDPTIQKKSRAILLKAQDNLNSYLTQVEGKTNEEVQAVRAITTPMQIHMEMKRELTSMIRETSKAQTKHMNAELESKKSTLSKKLRELNKATADCADQLKAEVHDARESLHQLLTTNRAKAQASAKARFQREGERNTKYWYQLTKPVLTTRVKNSLKKPPKEEEYMSALVDENGELKTDTASMVKIASAHHRTLQQGQPMTEERREAIEQIKQLEKPTLDEQQQNKMAALISTEEVEEALKLSNNGKSPGEDGLIYEFWKMWKSPRQSKNEVLDIPNMLKTVFNDVQTHGVTDPDFNKGLMFLLYKKKERTKIANYRPITLLNSDYKLMTKVLAIRLGDAAQTLIHPDQAGFVPGRSIFNNVRLTQAVIDYCDIYEVNGCIVALDQEKAYDRIAHDYLWEILENFGLPTAFISTVKALYTDAGTSVIVNGVIPSPIPVERGVRQGDPMSCLLYNIAIEPLAIMLRQSILKGISVPSLQERVITSLFADDTMIYVNEEDNLEELNRITTIFCTASTAQFNKSKTEYLPIGSKQFRDQVISTREFNGYSLPEDAPILESHDQLKTLGANTGHHPQASTQWEIVLERAKLIIDAWQRTHPSFRGKELLSKALILSLSFYLSTVNGMPKDVMNQTEKLLKNFLWDNKNKGYVSWDKAKAPHAKGGLNMPDIEARQESIHITWVRDFLANPEIRPKWAYIVDEIINSSITKSPIVDEESRINWILQSWQESVSANSQIPKYIRDALQTARKYNIGVNGLKFTNSAKRSAPIWYHFATTNNYQWNKPAAQCLRWNHGVRTVDDLMNVQTTPLCKNAERCESMRLILLAKLGEKFHPELGNTEGDALDHTPRRKRKWAEANPLHEPVLLNPDFTERGTLFTAVRIFQSHTTYKKRRTEDENITRPPVYRGPPSLFKRKIEVNIASKSLRVGCEDEVAAFAVVTVSDSDKITHSTRVSNPHNTNAAALLGAILHVLRSNMADDITIITKNKGITDAFLKNQSKWEDAGYFEVENADIWRAITFQMRKRTGETYIRRLKGETITDDLQEAIKLAKKALKGNAECQLNTTIHPDFEVTGARLSTLTHKVAYGLIREKKTVSPLDNANAQRVIKRIKEDFKSTFKFTPTTKSIFTSLRKSKINNKIKDFMWKLCTGTLKTGLYFRNMPGWEDKQYCSCGEIESPEHILLQCKEHNPQILWDYIKAVWDEGTNKEEWLVPTISAISAASSIRIKPSKGNKGEAQFTLTRRYQVYITEAAWLIWKRRNRRVIANEILPPHTLLKGWIEAIKERVTTDFYDLSHLPFKKQEQARDDFLCIWSPNDNDIYVVDGSFKTIEINLDIINALNSVPVNTRNNDEQILRNQGPRSFVAAPFGTQGNPGQPELREEERMPECTARERAHSVP